MMPAPMSGGPGAPAAATPSLATAPQQGSALGGSPVGMSGPGDPIALLKRAQLLLRSGAISMQQYEMIVARLGGGAGPNGGRGPAPPPGVGAGTPQPAMQNNPLAAPGG